VFNNWRKKVEDKRAAYPNYRRCVNCRLHTWPNQTADDLATMVGEVNTSEIVVNEGTHADHEKEMWVAWERWTAMLVKDGLIEPLAQGASSEERKNWADQAKKVTVRCGRCAGTGQFITRIENGKPTGPGGICFRCAGKGVQSWSDEVRNTAHDLNCSCLLH
jgi:hypothetical protein